MSIYTLEVITTPASEPVTLQELKDFLRLNDSSEDTLLTGFIKAARELFENLTGRAIVSTAYRQHFPTLSGPLYLMRAQVTAVTAVKYYDANDVLQTAAGYYTDVVSTPSKVWFDTYPTTSSGKRGNVAYVDFTAGWSSCPELVKTGIKLMSAHYYEFRAEYQETDLSRLPMGFKAVCDQYKTGLLGPWGAE